jgi:predicted DsbA family dithiol-disulfide isomerase
VPNLTIDVYADVVCPWCYIGEHRLQWALVQRPDVRVERRWRPFQLQPGMPRGGIPWRDFVRTKFGGEARARAAFAYVALAGAADGLSFDFERVVSAPNTVDAHRLILLAGARGRQWEMAEALFRAHFAEGRDLNDHDQLAGVAAAVGLDADQVRRYLGGNEGVAEVGESQREAARLGVRGVPFFVFDGRIALSGAQPIELFLEAIDAATAEPVE